jgi:hypothetical protein
LEILGHQSFADEGESDAPEPLDRVFPDDGHQVITRQLDAGQLRLASRVEVHWSGGWPQSPKLSIDDIVEAKLQGGQSPDLGDDCGSRVVIRAGRGHDLR